MFPTLLILLITTLVTAILAFTPPWDWLARAFAALGVLGALVASVLTEGLVGAGAPGASTGLPSWLDWLGLGAPFVSDGVSASLGAWVLLLGGICLLAMLRPGTSSPARRAVVTLLVLFTLYALVHTTHLLVFAGEMAFLAFLSWVYGSLSNVARSGRQMLALGAGTIFFFGAALLVGRTTGGDYSLATLSLAALSFWPLLLLALFVVCWLGMIPLMGWSAEGEPGGFGALWQALAVGLPVIVLVLRLEALITAQAPAGTLPGGWAAFTDALSWLGALTALVAAAGMLVWAGTTRWSALLTACTLSLALWGLAQDTPLGRYAGLAIFLAYGAARVTFALLPSARESNPSASLARAIALASVSAAPATVGFVGVWLLGAALSESGHPSLVMLLVGIVVLAACGLVLHIATERGAEDTEGPSRLPYLEWISAVGAALLIAGGVLPGLWLPSVADVSAVAGGRPAVAIPWAGLQSVGGLTVPLLLLGLGALVLGGIGWLVGALSKAGLGRAGLLLPTGLEHPAGRTRQDEAAAAPLLLNPPLVVWWLSLAWLETGIAALGRALDSSGNRLGALMGRLEGRFYLPLALILALLALLAISR